MIIDRREPSPRNAELVTTLDELRAVVGAPGRNDYVTCKELDQLDRFARAFIELSPLMILATAGADGRADATPRGDPPGSIKVLNDHLLLIPDRKGNNRLDSMQNILSNPYVGTLFLIPGRKESLRVNGRAAITKDAALLEPCVLNGRIPKLGILVEAEEVFFHCGAALGHAGAWEPEKWPDASGLPGLGAILKEQTRGRAEIDDVDPAEFDADLEDWTTNRF